MKPEEPEDKSPDRAEESRAAYALDRDTEGNTSMDDIRLIEQAARILQTSGDAAATLRRVMRESIAANESAVPHRLSPRTGAAASSEPSAVEILSMDADDDIEFEPPRLGGLPRPARFD